MDEEKQNFNSIIKKAMHANGVNVDNLSEKTGIAPSHIHALIEKKYDLLPSSPYVRGYIKKISSILNLDFQTIWDSFSNEIKLKQSGKEDILPSNRFAPKYISKKMSFFIIFGIIIISLLTFYSVKFLSNPTIQITSPKTTNLQVSEPRFTITGTTEQLQNKITINGSEIIADKNGNFQKEVYLDPGPNVFTINASKILGKTTKIERTIIYTPKQIDVDIEESSSSQINTN